MPFVDVPETRVWYQEVGHGPPIVCLHSGWGRGAMPFDDAADLLASRYRLIFPDRRGYGRSTPIDRLPIGYHHDAAVELGHLLDALAIDRAVLWGHSDGAISSAMLAAEHPERVSAVVLESIHFHRAKSKGFFEKYATDPDALPGHVVELLEADHGDRWRTVIRMHSRVWLDFQPLGGDFYGGLLERISAPTLLMFGERDPHTTPVEVAQLASHLRHATLAPLAEGGHSPHSEPATARLCSERVLYFLCAHGL